MHPRVAAISGRTEPISAPVFGLVLRTSRELEMNLFLCSCARGGRIAFGLCGQILDVWVRSQP
jgi:hypothetical protein